MVCISFLSFGSGLLRRRLVPPGFVVSLGCGGGAGSGWGGCVGLLSVLLSVFCAFGSVGSPPLAPLWGWPSRACGGGRAFGPFGAFFFFPFSSSAVGPVVRSPARPCWGRPSWACVWGSCRRPPGVACALRSGVRHPAPRVGGCAPGRLVCFFLLFCPSALGAGFRLHTPPARGGFVRGRALAPLVFFPPGLGGFLVCWVWFCCLVRLVFLLLFLLLFLCLSFCLAVCFVVSASACGAGRWSLLFSSLI